RPSSARLLAPLALMRFVRALFSALALLAARVDFFVDLPLGRVATLLVDQLFAARLLLVIAHASSFRNNEGAGRRRLRSLRTGWARRLRSRRPCRRRTPPLSRRPFRRRTLHPRSRRPCRRPAPPPGRLPGRLPA